MLVGTHIMIYSTNAEADRAFLRDVLKMSHVDAGEGWLIFSLPPAELGVHPATSAMPTEFHLMCRNIEDFVGEMALRGVTTTPVQREIWGAMTHVVLPSGARLALYEPLHVRPEPSVVAQGGPAKTEPVAKAAKRKPSTGRQKKSVKAAKSGTSRGTSLKRSSKSSTATRSTPKKRATKPPKTARRNKR